MEKVAAIKFDTHVTGLVDFHPSWQSLHETKSRSVQATAPPAAEMGTDSLERHDASTEPLPSTEAADLEFAPTNLDELAAFLQRVEPIMQAAIEENYQTVGIFAELDQTNLDDGENRLELLYSLRHEGIEAQCLDVGWNASGTSIAVAYGHTLHEAWCDHGGSVCVWYIERRSLNASKADVVLDIPACACSLLWHPTRPSWLLGGTATGQVHLWDLSLPETTGYRLCGSNSGHTEPVSGFAWLPDDKIMSVSHDGRILVWEMPRRSSELDLVQAFVILATDIPRSAVDGKTIVSEKEVGITACAVSSSQLTGGMFAVATHAGVVFQCSLSSTAGTGRYVGEQSDVPVLSPVGLALKPHRGPVFGVAASPFEPRIVASCAADGILRLYNLLATEPMLSLEPGAGYLYAVAWSPVRPLVVACGTESGLLTVYDLALDPSGAAPACCNEIQTDGSSAPVISVSFCRSRPRVLAAGDAKGVIRVWELSESFGSQTTGEEQQLKSLIDRFLK